MSRKLFAAVLALALLAPAAASAHDATCTPGFWKNHEEVWCTGNPLPRYHEDGALSHDWCNTIQDCDALLTDLNTGGACPDTDGDGDPDCARHDASEFLNSCFYSDPGYNPCPND